MKGYKLTLLRGGILTDETLTLTLVPRGARHYDHFLARATIVVAIIQIRSARRLLNNEWKW